MNLQVNAVKAALVSGNFIKNEIIAEERARNIVQVLEGFEANEPQQLYAIVADCLWVRHTEVRHLVEASKACVKAWTLAQEPTVTARLSLLTDVGVPFNHAIDFLNKLGLA